MACGAPLVVLSAVALGAGGRVDPPVDLVLAQVVATVRQVPLGGVGELVAWFDLLLMGMAVGAERFLMAGGAGQALPLGVKAVLGEEVRRLVVERLPGVGMAFTAIGHSRDRLRMGLDDAGSVGARISSLSAVYSVFISKIYLILPLIF